MHDVTPALPCLSQMHIDTCLPTIPFQTQDLNPRNFVTKIVKYDKVVDIPNSMTVLHDLLPVSLIMAQRKLTGTHRAALWLCSGVAAWSLSCS